MAAGVALALGLGGGDERVDLSHPTVKPDVPATPTNLAARLASNSPLLASDPTDSSFVVLANRHDSPDFGCSLQLSGDGGRSWVTADPVPRLPRGADKCYGPEVAFDRDGVLYYLFLGLQGRGNTPSGAFLTTSRNRGRTFSTPRRLLGELNFQVRMAMDRSHGRLHFVWQQANSVRLGGFSAPGNPILAAHSDDGGKTLSDPVPVNDRERLRSTAPALALGPDGDVHVLYYDLRDDFRDYEGRKGPTWKGKWSLVTTRSGDGGQTFSRGKVVDAGVVPPERVMLIFTMPPPALATGPSGRLYASWYDGRNGDWDVFLRRSADGGASWGRPARLNDDRRRNGRHQYLPRLSVAPDGRVDAIWYDRRGNAENRGNDVYYSYSRDGASPFSRNLRLTTRDSDSEIGQVYEIPSALGPPVKKEFGSRIGLLAQRSRTVAAWTDTSNTGRAPPSQDIHATEVAFAMTGAKRDWLRIVGVVLAVAGLALLVTGIRGAVLGACLAALVTVASSCDDSDRPLPPQPPRVAVSLRDGLLEHGAVPSGRVVFEVVNRGRTDHALAVIPLPENFPPIREQLRGANRRVVNPLASLPALHPGSRATFAVDLERRRYAFVDFLVDPDGVSHARKGEAVEFRPR